MTVPPGVEVEPLPTHATPHTLTRGFVCVVIGAVCIGFAPIFVRLSEVGPVATAVWRMTLSLPLLWSLAAFNARPAGEEPTPERPGTGWAAMAVAGFFFAADLAVWHWSLHLTTALNSTLLSNFAPVFVVLFGWAAWGQTVTRRFVLAMVVALAGTCLLLGRDFHLDRRALLGDALGLVTAFFYGGYQLSIKALRGRFETTDIMARSGLVAAALLLPLALGTHETMLPHTTHGWVVLAALALIVHAGGQGLIAYGIGKLPSAVASVSLLVQPVTAAIAAAVILHETVALVQVVGMTLVLVGVFVARQEGR